MTVLTSFMDNVFLGTSGWSYRDWIGPFYTEKDKSLLGAYSKIFRTVEIDSTFYRYPTKGTVMGWVKYSPEGFIYTAKLPKLITHTKKLDINEGIEDDLQKFIELMEPLYLSGKLGCILIQLPPKFNYKPFCGYWFYGAANDYQRAHYYSSWGLLANVPTVGGILRRISILTGLDSILGG